MGHSALVLVILCLAATANGFLNSNMRQYSERRESRSTAEVGDRNFFGNTWLKSLERSSRRILPYSHRAPTLDFGTNNAHLFKSPLTSIRSSMERSRDRRGNFVTPQLERRQLETTINGKVSSLPANFRRQERQDSISNRRFQITDRDIRIQDRRTSNLERLDSRIINDRDSQHTKLQETVEIRQIERNVQVDRSNTENRERGIVRTRNLSDRVSAFREQSNPLEENRNVRENVLTRDRTRPVQSRTRVEESSQKMRQGQTRDLDSLRITRAFIESERVRSIDNTRTRRFSRTDDRIRDLERQGENFRLPLLKQDSLLRSSFERLDSRRELTPEERRDSSRKTRQVGGRLTDASFERLDSRRELTKPKERIRNQEISESSRRFNQEERIDDRSRNIQRQSVNFRLPVLKGDSRLRSSLDRLDSRRELTMPEERRDSSRKTRQVGGRLTDASFGRLDSRRELTKPEERIRNQDLRASSRKTNQEERIDDRSRNIQRQSVNFRVPLLKGDSRFRSSLEMLDSRRELTTPDERRDSSRKTKQVGGRLADASFERLDSRRELTKPKERIRNQELRESSRRTNQEERIDHLSRNIQSQSENFRLPLFKGDSRLRSFFERLDSRRKLTTLDERRDFSRKTRQVGGRSADASFENLDSRRELTKPEERIRNQDLSDSSRRTNQEERIDHRSRNIQRQSETSRLPLLKRDSRLRSSFGKLDSRRELTKSEERRIASKRTRQVERRSADATRSIPKISDRLSSIDENNNERRESNVKEVQSNNYERSMATPFLKLANTQYIPDANINMLLNAAKILLLSFLIAQMTMNSSKTKRNWFPQMTHFMSITKDKVL